MNNIFESNAYHILGLDTSASQKLISRRSKELEKLAKIGEFPDYETDLPFLDVERNEKNIKNATERLTSPVKKVREYFFWFELHSKEDEEAVNHVCNNQLNDAVKIWQAKSNKDGVTGFVSRRNLAILYSSYLVKHDNQKLLKRSLKFWGNLIYSDKFWQHFEKTYLSYDELGTDAAAISKFRQQVLSEIADFYAGLAETHGNNIYYQEYANTFNVRGNKIQTQTLEPIYHTLEDAAKELKELEISHDDNDEEAINKKKNKLDELNQKIKQNVENLHNLNVHDGKIETIRDQAAEAMRAVAIDLFNNLEETSKPASIIEDAAIVAGTNNLKDKLEKEIGEMQTIASNNKVLMPIVNFMEKERHKDALDKILIELDNDNNEELNEQLETLLCKCVVLLSDADIENAKTKLENGDTEDARLLFTNTKNFLIEYIDYFSIEQDIFDNFVSGFNKVASVIHTGNTQQADEYRGQIINEIRRIYGDSSPQAAFLLNIMDTNLYAEICNFNKKANNKERVKKIAWTVGIIIFILLLA